MSLSQILTKIKRHARDGRLIARTTTFLWPYVSGFLHLFFDRSRPLFELHIRSVRRPIPSTGSHEFEVTGRIFAAFRKMWHDQNLHDARAKPSGLWQGLLNDGYAQMLEATESVDVSKFRDFICNFGLSDKSLGFEGQADIRLNAKSLFLKPYMMNEMFAKQYALWKWLNGNRRATSRLAYSPCGNQSYAALREGDIPVSMNSFINDYYGDVLSGMVQDKIRPVIADLGGGSGLTAYYMLKNLRSFCYMDFDLPQVLCIAAYQLMMMFPEKSFCLYGESNMPFDFEKFDFILMPSFMLRQAPEKSVDLFINRVSLGEMTKEGAFFYIEDINRVTKEFFFHFNHDGRQSRYLYSNSVRGPLAYEYPVGSDFRLLFRYPEINHLLRQGRADFDEDIFIYFYQRKAV